MTANESKCLISSPIGLQIDNLVYNQHGEMVTIRANDFHRWMQPRMSGDYGIYAIPLTTEILEKCGFTYRNDLKDIMDHGFFMLYISDKIYFNSYPKAIIQYLHQLQNLYFSLTGEELECNL